MNRRIKTALASLAFILGITACGGGGEFTPPVPLPTSISISGLPASAMAPGQSAQLTAMLTYADSSSRDVTATASWSTSNAAVLSVSSVGTIVAVAPGQADVIASAEGLSSRASIRVEQPSPRLALFAGSMGGAGSTDGVGADARFNAPVNVAIDAAGNVYVGDAGNHTIRKISPAGAVSTLAGAAGQSGSADGTGTQARFSRPTGIATDSAGSVYVADTGNHTIRRITATGVVSTLAGAAGVAGSADGGGAAARLNSPKGVAADAAGNVYVADTGNYTIRRITPAGLVTTLAGAAGALGNVDGTGAEARFGACIAWSVTPIKLPPGPLPPPPEDCWGPSDVAAGADGYLYVADTGNFTVRRIGPAGEVTTLPGRFSSSTTVQTFASISVRYVGPSGVAADRAGTVYVVVANDPSLYRVTSAGSEQVQPSPFENTGWIGEPEVRAEGGVAADAAGNVYVPDTRNHTIRRISAGEASTLAGSALLYGYVDDAGAQARFGFCRSEVYFGAITYYCIPPQGLATDSAGNVYVSDNNVIRRISPAGIVGTWAVGLFDSYQWGYINPRPLAVDSQGNAYTSVGEFTIRKVTPDGAVTTLAGATGESGSAEGTGADARFGSLFGLASDGAGNVYVADHGNHAIRKVTPAGVVTTLAGAAGDAGSADGTGPDSRFDGPYGLAGDAAGNLFVADSGNHTIRRITPAGVVTTLAGTAGLSGSTDAAGADARFNSPGHLAVDGSGNLYVADLGSYTIRKVTPDGVVTTVVGIAGRSGWLPGSPPGGLTEIQGLAISGRSLYITQLNGVAVVTNVP